MASDLPNHFAASMIWLAGTPHVSATAAGVYSRTVSFSASKPSVCASIYAASHRPSQSNTWSMLL